MPRSKSICLALSRLICAGCSKRSDGAFAPPPPAYVGIPAGLMARRTVKDVPLTTTADILTRRGIYMEGFEKCAAEVDAIRDHDAKAPTGSQAPLSASQ